VNVVATTDGSEQAEIQSLDTISFSIGLINGLTSQAFEFIARDSENGIAIRHTRFGDVKRKQTSSVIVFNGYRYPERADESRQLIPRPDEERFTASTHAVEERSHPNFAIVVRTFLRGGGGQPIPRFVCGGIEAAGTAAAGVYLKNHWKELLTYYEEFGKDLEGDSLAVILQFWGRKAESARPEVIRLSFFQPGDCEFYFYDHKTKGWNPEEKKSETGDRPDAQSPGPTSRSQTVDSKQTSKPRATGPQRKADGKS